MIQDPEVHIRRIRDDEIDAISALTVESYTSTYEIERDSSYYVQLGQVAERASKHQVWVAVASESDELLGTVTTPEPGEFLGLYAEPTDMDFRLLATAPAARGRGIGRALVEHCAGLARERGASRLVLHTSDDMNLAISLYERMGFSRLTKAEDNFVFPPNVHYPVRVYGLAL